MKEISNCWHLKIDFPLLLHDNELEIVTMLSVIEISNESIAISVLFLCTNEEQLILNDASI